MITGRQLGLLTKRIRTGTKWETGQGEPAARDLGILEPSSSAVGCPASISLFFEEMGV